MAISKFSHFSFDDRAQQMPDGGFGTDRIRTLFEQRDQQLEDYLASLTHAVSRCALGVGLGGYAEQVNGQSLSTTPAVVTYGGTDCAVTVVLKARRTYRVSALTMMTHDTTSGVGVLEITENGTVIQAGTAFVNASGYAATLGIWRCRTSSVDQTLTYGLKAWVVSGTGNIVASGPAPTHIIVDDLGILPS